MWVVALSGAVASGKTTAAEAILARCRGVRLSTRLMIVERKKASSRREDLQRAGDELDVETGFSWVAEEVARAVQDWIGDVVLVDAVRRREQVDHLRNAFPGRVRHVHLTVEPDELAARHGRRKHEVEEPTDYASVGMNATEAAIDDLAAVADVVFDPTRLDAASMAAVALVGTKLIRREVVPLVDVIVGGQYGSEGKGNVCSYIASQYDVLMRVGGPNAGHKVKDPDFDFVHLPSGTLHNPAARLLIGAGATLSLKRLFEEIDQLEIGAERLSIDPQAIVIEASDVAFEEGSLEVIGSTKKGVGAATARKILNRSGTGTFGERVRLARDVPELAPFVRSAWAQLELAYEAGERVMLEGTQGTDLSLHHGSWPHVTSRETTASGTMADAGVAPDRMRRVIMVVRTYPIRVGGTSGYMGREIEMEVVAGRSGIPVDEIRATEIGTISGKPRRIAEFDLGQIRRAAAINGATEIALTFADYLSAANRGAKHYDALSAGTRAFIDDVEEATGVPVTMVAVGPRREDMIERMAA